MRQPILIALLASSVIALSACEGSKNANVTRAMDAVNAVDQKNMAELMLASGSPDEAVDYFTRQVERDPDNIANQRGLARSLVRAGRLAEAIPSWRKVAQHPDATQDDKVMLAEAHIRANDWAAAETVLGTVPPTHETFDRYRLEAMIADGKQDWKKADHFYETAAGLTTRPSGVFNNWGFSKLTRGAPREAEQLFGQALQHDPQLFTAKTNMALARAAQGNYSLPLVKMTQQERAMLLHTMGIAAIRKGDINVGRTLLQDAIETHPQHYEEAVRALRALEGGRG